MDFPAAKTPTITPAIENIHRIMRSPPYKQAGLTTRFPFYYE
jgi:hypothetical protein